MCVCNIMGAWLGFLFELNLFSLGCMIRVILCDLGGLEGFVFGAVDSNIVGFWLDTRVWSSTPTITTITAITGMPVYI